MADGCVMGTGIDLVENSRLRDMIERWGPRFKDRVFTPREQAYCNSKAAPYRHYAGRWAVKEAVSKAFGTGIAPSITWLDIETVNDSNSGSPAVNLSKRSTELAAKLGIGRIHVSLSHTHDYAAAHAVLTSSTTSRREDRNE